MEEKKMILVTDGYDDKPICVASNTIAARKSASSWKWVAIWKLWAVCWMNCGSRFKERRKGGR